MKNYKVIIAFVFVILLVSSSIVLSGFWKDKSTVKRVELYGNTTLSKEEIFDFAKLNDSIICSNSLTLDMIESRIAKHPNIKKVYVVRESAAIKIEVSEKNPFAIATNGKEIYLVDDQLTMYPLKKEQRDIDLPVISGMSSQLDLTNFGKDDLKNLKIAQYIISETIKMNKSLYHYISEISFLDSNGINIYSSDDAVPIYLLEYESLSNGKDKESSQRNINNTVLRTALDTKLVYLSNFLRQVRVYKTNNSFAYIDMRYSDMIVVKNNKMPVTE
jgi:cell division septal protein FtsQ